MLRSLGDDADSLRCEEWTDEVVFASGLIGYKIELTNHTSKFRLREHPRDLDSQQQHFSGQRSEIEAKLIYIYIHSNIAIVSTNLGLNSPASSAS